MASRAKRPNATVSPDSTSTSARAPDACELDLCLRNREVCKRRAARVRVSGGARRSTSMATSLLWCQLSPVRRALSAEGVCMIPACDAMRCVPQSILNNEPPGPHDRIGGHTARPLESDWPTRASERRTSAVRPTPSEGIACSRRIVHATLPNALSRRNRSAAIDPCLATMRFARLKERTRLGQT